MNSNIEQFREAFENWAIYQCIYNLYVPAGEKEYADYTTECAWRAYCAGAAKIQCTQN